MQLVTKVAKAGLAYLLITVSLSAVLSVIDCVIYVFVVRYGIINRADVTFVTFMLDEFSRILTYSLIAGLVTTALALSDFEKGGK